MFTNCASCNGTESFVYWCITASGSTYVLCRNCRKGSNASIPDVAYPYGSGTHTEENICYPKGHQNEGQRIPFSSKRGKAEAMRIAGIREAGDRHHGSLSRH